MEFRVMFGCTQFHGVISFIIADVILTSDVDSSKIDNAFLGTGSEQVVY